MDRFEKGAMQQTVNADCFVRRGSGHLLRSDFGVYAGIAGRSDPCRKPVCRYGCDGFSGCPDLRLCSHRTFGGSVLSGIPAETVSGEIGVRDSKPPAGFAIWSDARSSFRNCDSQCLAIDYIDNSSRHHGMVSGMVE